MENATAGVAPDPSFANVEGMFKSKTIFIVGAGASCEAGLPSGERLKDRIASLLDIRFDDWGRDLSSGDHQIVQALRDHVESRDGRSGNINPFLTKAWRIRDVVPAAAISIDNYLDAHRGDEQMELCGKLGIVRSILDAESNSKLRSTERGDDRFELRAVADTWYVKFFQMLTENVSKSDSASVFDNVSIITFNYDRCIERFLLQAIEDYYDLSRPEAEAIVATLQIYHPYGQVGLLPWQERGRGVPFGSERSSLLSIAGQIKTFSEGMADEGIVARMHEDICNADTIVFLGFAFHPTNMRLLTPGIETSTRRVFATTLGLSDADEAVIETDISKMLGKEHLDFVDQQEAKPEMAAMTCGAFFTQYFRSMSAEID